MKKLFKRSLSLMFAVIVLLMSCLSVFAASDGYDGKTYSYCEEDVSTAVTVGNQYTFAGGSNLTHPQTYHYYINDRTAYCVWSEKPSVTAKTAKMNKYFLANSNLRTKTFYYLTWASSSSSPDKVTTGYYDTISSTFLSAYKKSIFADVTTLTSKSTYHDVMVAALSYIVEHKDEGGEYAGTSGAYQYCLSHVLMDYMQQKTLNGGLGYYWTLAVEELYSLAESLPSMPTEYRVFYCYPAKTSEQSLMSIEEVPVTTGKLKITKTSSDTSITSGNSNYSLQGAVYTVYSNSACTTKVTSLTTGSSGTVTSGDIEAGTYYVKETTAPKGYNLSSTVSKVTIKADTTTTLNVTDTPKTGYAKIVKTSSNPELTDGNDCYSLEGAVFTVYTDAACTKQHSTLTTGADGTITSGKMALGTYYVKETTAPKGYALDSTVHKITVSNGETATIEVQDTPQADPVAVLLRKRNATTGEETDIRLAGAEYTFSYYDSYYSTVEELEGVTPTRSWVFKTNEEGYCQYDVGWLVNGDELYYQKDLDETGVETQRPMLPLGTIAIKETKAPEGFYIDENTYIQQVTSVGQDIYIDSYNEGLTSDEYEVPMKQLTVNKVWEDDNDRDGIRPQSITVNLYQDDATEPFSTATLSAENNWEYTFTDLPEGCVDYTAENFKHIYEYSLSEVEVEDYETATTGIVQSEDDELSYSCTITNTHKPDKIVVSGVKNWSDFDNIMGYRPDSIIVHLFDADDMNTSLQTVTVTEENNWQYEFSDLYKYKNHGQEIQYTVIEDAVDKYDTSVSGMNITNKIKTGTVTLSKDSGTLTPLQGVKFELYKADGEQVSVSIDNGVYSFAGNASVGVTTLTTDENGQVYIKNIPYGDYYFLETQTLEGYMPCEEKISFTVEEGSDDSLNPNIIVRNNKILMYNTGGNGDSMIYIIAAIIGVFALILSAIYITIKSSKKGKKNMKKLFSLVMAVMLIGAMLFTCVPGVSAANAALDTSATTSFSFVCEKQGYEFSIYNVGSIVKTSNPYEVKYESTIPSLSDAILNGDSVALLTALDELSVSELGAVVGTYNTTADGQSKEFADQEQGIYYVRATNFPAGVREVTNSVFALPYYTAEDGWNYSLNNIALAAKVVDDIPEIAKTITNSTKDNVNFTDVSLGETVDFEIKSSKAGSYSNTASKDFRLNSYVVADKMAEGFTLDQDSFEVKLVDADGNAVATLNRDTDYVVSITADDGKATEFTVALTTEYLQGSAFYSSTVSDVITSYSAVLNKYATTAFEGNPNEAVSLTYSNKNDVTAVIDGNTVYAYTYGIEVNKQDDSNNPLAGAKFALYKSEADAKAQKNAIAAGTSDANGLVLFKTDNDEVIRLASGTYYIVETESPAGYNRYTDVIEVKVTAEYAETFTEGTWISSAPEDGVAVVTVTDSKVILPQTGGAGNMIIYIIAGVGITLGVAFLAISKKKKSAKAEN